MNGVGVLGVRGIGRARLLASVVVLGLIASMVIAVTGPALGQSGGQFVDQHIDGDPACNTSQFPGRAEVTSELEVVAQGFTPTYGRLMAVDVCLEVALSLPGASLSIVELDDQGQVSRTVASQGFTPNGGGLLGRGTRWNHVTLEQPATLVPGTRYEVRLTAPRLLYHWRATCGTLLTGCPEGSPDRYAGGSAHPIGAPADFGFRTWTDTSANLTAGITGPPMICPDARALADTVVTVANTGAQAVGAFDVTLHAGSGPALGTATVNGVEVGHVVSLPPGAFGISDETVLDLPTGRTSLRAVVDPANEIRESTTADNEASVATTSVPCLPSALENLDVEADAPEILAGLLRLPFTEVDGVLVGANAHRFSDVTATPFHATPFHATPFRATPFHATPFRATPFHATPFRATPFYATPFRATPFHATPFRATQLDALLGAASTSLLDRVPLTLVPSDVDWTDRLRTYAENTAHPASSREFAEQLLQVPNQDRTLGDVLRRLTPAMPVGLHEVELGGAFELSILGIALAGQPLATIPAPDGHASWCVAIAAVSHHACGQGIDQTTDTPLTLDLLGVPMNQFSIGGVRVADIAPRRLTPLFDVPLAQSGMTDGQYYRVSSTSLGSMPVVDALTDASLCAASCGGTLAEVEAARGFRADARGGDLVAALRPEVAANFGLADALLGLVALADLPWGRFDTDTADAVAVGAAVGDPCPRVTWTVEAGAVQDANHGPVVDPTLELSLPRGFRPDLSAVSARADGTSVPVTNVATTTANSRVQVSITVDAIVQQTVAVSVPACAAATLGSFAVDADASWPTFAVSETALTLRTDTLDDPPLGVAPVRVTERDEIDTPTTARTLRHQELVFRHITGPDDLDFFRIPLGVDLGGGVSLAPGDRLRVFMAPPPALPTEDPDNPIPGRDFDLALFSPSESPLRDAPFDATPFHATSAPIVPVEGSGTMDGTYGTQSGDTVDDTALQAEPVLVAPFHATPFHATPFRATPLREISANRGDEPEYIDVVIRPGEDSGAYIVQVSGYNGDRSNRAYVLWFEVLKQVPVLGACTPPDTIYPPPSGTMARPGANTETLILVDETSLRRAAGGLGDDVMQRLHLLAAHPRVNGVVMAYDRDPTLNNLTRTWRTTSAWCDTVAANNIVGGLRGIIADAEESSPNLQNIVMVGADDNTPMLRTWDGTDLANERAYLAEHLAALGAPNGPSLAALAAGTVVTDDALGGGMPLPWLDDAYWVPRLAVGRLVESPMDIMAQVDQFLASDGVLDTGSLTGLVTGYDFLTDGSKIAADAFTDAGLGVTEVISDTWTAQDLLAALGDRDTERAVAILNGHADPHRLLSAAGDLAVRSGATVPADEVISTGDVADRDLGRLVAAASCHFGFNVVDSFAAAGVAEGPLRDWPQVVAQRQAVLIANTGYGYGTEGEAPGLSEALIADLASQLFMHETVGQAWASTKQRYAATPAVYGWHHRKAGVELVLYGLPMYRFSNAAGPADTPPPAVVTDDGHTGLDVVSLSTGTLPIADQHSGVHLRRRSVTTGAHHGSWFEVVGDTGPGVLSVEGQPLVAQRTIELDLGGRDAGGFFFTGAQLQDIAENGNTRGFDPLFVRPLVSASSKEPETQALGVAFPATSSRTTTVADRTFLSIPMSRFRGFDVRADGQVVGQMTVLTRVDGLLYLRESGTDDLVPPLSRSVRLSRTSEGNQDRISIRAEVSDRSDVARVATGLRIVSGGTDQFRHLELGRVTSQVVPVTGGGTVTASTWNTSTLVPRNASVEIVLAQAVDKVGNVGTYHNKLVTPAVREADGHDPSLTVTGTLANGWYTSATIAVDGDAASYDVTINGVPFGTVQAGESFDLTGSGLIEVTAVPTDGSSPGATVVVPLDTTPPNVVFVSPTRATFDAGLTLVSGQVRELDVTCHDAGSGVTGCTWAIHAADADGNPVGEPVVAGNPQVLHAATIGAYVVVARATDVAGHATVATAHYTVTSTFSFLGFDNPLQPFPAVTSVNAGSTIPTKFQVFEGDTLVTDAAGLRLVWIDLGSSSPTCSIPMRTELDAMNLDSAEPVGSSPPLRFSDTHFILNAVTQSAWRGTCRVLIAEAEDGLRLYAVVRLT